MNGSRKQLAILAILLGGMLGLVLATQLVTLYRDRLHYQCSGGAPGTEAEGWWCGDGIGYLIPLAAPTLLCGVVVLVALLVAVGVHQAEVARTALVVLAIVSVAIGVAATSVAISDPREVPPGESRAGYWAEAVLPAAILLAVALGIGVASLRATRAGGVLAVAAAGGVLVALVVQPGLGVAAAPALGMLLASAALADPVSGGGGPVGGT